jgi:hypothetical protein
VIRLTWYVIAAGYPPDCSDSFDRLVEVVYRLRYIHETRKPSFGSVSRSLTGHPAVTDEQSQPHAPVNET